MVEVGRIVERMSLLDVPFDKRFYLANGRDELCHATGDAVKIHGEWWNEYVDSNGDYHYGR